ncbi:hypothetical protein GCM10022234_00170 [Aeromicrobium panaciterrae]|uniref:hypothetical protein n=1 Tax=Aeromicrobium panaciterrae TaxID=363861 RepID=UPI0031D5F4C2
MSLLDDARHEVTLYPEIEIIDDLGNKRRVPDLENGVILYGRVGSPQSSENTSVGNQTVATQKVFRTRSFIGGAFAAASYAGRMWDVIGEPDFHDGSDVTRHYSVTLQARTAKAV